jgi:hypothetical protein
MQQALQEANAAAAENEAQEREDATKKQAQYEARMKAREARVDLDIDDYEASNGMTFPGKKSKRQLEIEKIHRLAKMCLETKNTTPPCLDIITADAKAGKFYIMQESRERDRLIKG